jgi:hypothetical protein
MVCHQRRSFVTDDRPGGPQARALSDEMEECVGDCLTTHRVCLDTLTYLLESSGRGDGRLLKRLMDCAEMCETAAQFLVRGSEIHPRVCGVCAEVCAVCAEACEEFPDDQQLRACAQACHQAAASCRSMAALMTA